MFRIIPGLEGRVRAARRHAPQHLSQLPRLLDARLRLKASPRLRFAGQITGCEGYVESAAVGLIAGRFAAAERLGEEPALPPPTTAIGALLSHITGGHIESIDAGPRSFQPMNVNFGLFPLIAEPRFDEAGKRLAGPERGSPASGRFRLAPSRTSRNGWTGLASARRSSRLKGLPKSTSRPGMRSWRRLNRFSRLGAFFCH